jgi:hypothetical protein
MTDKETSRDAPAAEERTSPAWEQIRENTYLPYRVRGSWKGGVLG